MDSEPYALWVVRALFSFEIKSFVWLLFEDSKDLIGMPQICCFHLDLPSRLILILCLRFSLLVHLINCHLPTEVTNLFLP